MKKSHIIGIVILIVLLVVIIGVLLKPQEIIVHAPSIPNQIFTSPVREPEFRGPPIREYKPNTYKQKHT